MIATKGKRKLRFRDQDFYWWIKKERDENPRIHIISADKKVYLKKAFDKEIGISTGYIEHILNDYFEEQGEG